MRKSILLLLLVALRGGRVAMADPGDAYTESIETWRAQRLERLTSETGYLAVAGFVWLEVGDNTVGTSPDNPVVLPPGTAPQHAGLFRVDTDGGVEARFESGVQATIEGEPFTFRKVASDAGGSPDHIHVDRLTMWVIERNGKPAIRIVDPQNDIRKHFQGISSYPVDPGFKVKGAWVPLSPPLEILVPNFLGYEEPAMAYGQVVFELEGQSHRLTALQESAADSTLFLVFEDATTAKETYGGGRFLYADLEADGSVALDFNKAYNPPCAFNPYTTCPRPPEGNRLLLKVTAGEKVPLSGGH